MTIATTPTAPVPTLARAVRSFDSGQRHAESRWSFDWLFAGNDVAFAGHFPNRPILPGVFLLEMAQRAAEWALFQSSGQAFSVQRVQRMRFVRPVQPGDACTLWLTWAPNELTSSRSLALSLSFKKGDVDLAHGALQATRSEVPA
jgi:acyl dehydratase